MDTAGAAKWVREYVRGCDHKDFRAYAGDLAEAAPDRFLWLMEQLVRLGRMCGGKVLDVGSGFGWEAVAISFLGGCRVVANDIRPKMTALTAERVAAIRARRPVCVEVLTGDICALDMPEGSVDAIVCNQMIEHVHDLEGMLRATFRLLKPGGRIVVTNDNNVLNRQHLGRLRDMWKRRDSDWGFIEELKKQRPEENREIRPYAVIREEIVRRANSRLSNAEVRAVVEATAGLVRPEIERLATTYSPSVPLPKPPEFSWCRDPITGEYCERQLDPFDVAEVMRRCGFRVRVRHGFRRWPLSWLNGIAVRPINRWLFQVRPFFILLGVRST